MARELDELAERCERESENWHGTPMRQGLLDIAKELRARASKQQTTGGKQ